MRLANGQGPSVGGNCAMGGFRVQLAGRLQVLLAVWVDRECSGLSW